MKKLLTIGFAAATMAAVATEITVAQVGVTSISSSYKHTVVAMSYADLAGSGDLKVADLVKTTNLSAGDKLYTFTDGNFECWTLSAPGGTWQHADTKYTMNSSGELTAASGTAASDVTKPVGTGLWLVRSSTSTSAPIIIYGAPVSQKSYSIAGAGTYLVGNPNQSETVPTVTGAQTDDVILVPNDTTMPLRYRYNGTNWSYVNPSTHLPTTGSAPLIPAGTGFWYVAQGAVTIAWE